MKKRLGLIFALPLLIATSSAALAAATSEEADRLTKLFQSYLGAEPGVVEVKADGDNYTATIDFAPLAKKAEGAGGNAARRKCPCLSARCNARRRNRSASANRGLVGVSR